MTKLLRVVVRVLVFLTLLGGATLIVSGAARADPTAADWARLRMCESSGRYDVVADHGHYGAYQFDIATWRSVGGVGLPSEASAAEQDYRALYLYRMRGWQPWECAGILGLRQDRTAQSRQVPSRAEAASMAPSSRPRPGPAPGGGPPWPGKVYAFGDCDPALRVWQLRMNDLGYDFDGTGCYREETRRAVLSLQHARGIPDSGRLGPQTWRAAWTAP